MLIESVAQFEQLYSPGDAFCAALSLGHGFFTRIHTGRVISTNPANGTVDLAVCWNCDDGEYSAVTVNLPEEFFCDPEDLSSYLYDMEASFYEGREAKAIEIAQWSESFLHRLGHFEPFDSTSAYSDCYMAKCWGGGDYLSVYPFFEVFTYHNDETGYDYWVMIDSASKSSRPAYISDERWEQVGRDINGNSWVLIDSEIFDAEGEGHIVVSQDDIAPLIDKVVGWVGWVWD